MSSISFVSQGVFGYLLYGRNADVLVTNDLHADASTGPGRSFEKFVVCMVTISSFSTIGPIVSVLSEIPEGALGLTDDTVGGVFAARAVRMAILAVGFVISLVAYDYLGYFESLIGGICSVATSLLIPALCYGRLEPQLSSAQRCGNWMLVILALVAMGVISTLDSVALIHSMKNMH